MIIDCHGHYTTAPAEAEAWRKLQIAALDNPAQSPQKAALRISDDHPSAARVVSWNRRDARTPRKKERAASAALSIEVGNGVRLSSTTDYRLSTID